MAEFEHTAGLLGGAARLAGKAIGGIASRTAKDVGNLAGRAAKFTAKRPGLVAAGAAGGVLYGQAKGKAKALEGEIMRNRVGAPGGKFVYAELEKFAMHKRELSDRVVFLKNAADNEPKIPYETSRTIGQVASKIPHLALGAIGGGVGGGFGKGIGDAGAAGITSLVRSGARKVKDKLILEPQRKKILQQLTTEDPVISTYEEGQPGATEQAFSSMRRVAPEMSVDPNVVKSYLREAAQTGGTVNHLTLKQLAEAETAINRAAGRA